MKKLCLALPLLLMLVGCGPKEIGSDAYEALSATTTSGSYAAPGVSSVDAMRYPMTGASRTQRNLYYFNRPDVMMQVQDWNRRRFNALSGRDDVEPADPAYRAVPKQRSPFRQ